MLLIDLFCGAGAVSLGYVSAGWTVLGVDIEEQPNYPFPFLRMDALDTARLLPLADAVHASPPCLRDTSMRHAPGAKGLEHPELIPQTRALLMASGKPYVLENVMGAELLTPVVLRGSMFNLGTRTADGTRFQLKRERKFETNWPLRTPQDFPCDDPVIGVYGGHVRLRAAKAGGRGTADFPGEDKKRLMREAMGIDYPQTMAEMSQAVPPAYTEQIGRQLMRYVARLP